MQNLLVNRLTESQVQRMIIYQDDMLLVLNKPSGLAVHNAGGSQHNLEQYFHWLQFDLPTPPLLAHRLDRGTSGCLVLARNVHAARRMQQLFTDQKMVKSYLADVHGVVREDAGHITVPLSKLSPEKKHWWMKADPNATLSAHTEFRVIGRSDNMTRLVLTPHTGRTHQLRVHSASIGHPIVGDYIYGDDPEEERKHFLHLHAAAISFPFYENLPPISLTASLPLHMVRGATWPL